MHRPLSRNRNPLERAWRKVYTLDATLLAGQIIKVAVEISRNASAAMQP